MADTEPTQQERHDNILANGFDYAAWMIVLLEDRVAALEAGADRG